MELEYLDDPESGAQPVLLTYGNDPIEAALLRDAIEPLVAGDTDQQVRIDALPGFHSVNGCTLVAQIASSDLGVVPLDGADRVFRCALRPATWREVAELLEPFSAPHTGPDVHQYLSTDGPIYWIVATSRQW